MLPSGCVIQIEYGWRCIKTCSMELIAVSTGEFCKLFKVTSFHCFLHLLDPLRYHLLFTPIPKVVAPLASVAKIESTMVPRTAIYLHCIASFSPSAAIFFHSIASFPLLVTVDCHLSWCIDNLLFIMSTEIYVLGTDDQGGGYLCPEVEKRTRSNTFLHTCCTAGLLLLWTHLHHQLFSSAVGTSPLKTNKLLSSSTLLSTNTKPEEGTFLHPQDSGRHHCKPLHSFQWSQTLKVSRPLRDIEWWTSYNSNTDHEDIQDELLTTAIMITRSSQCVCSASCVAMLSFPSTSFPSSKEQSQLSSSMLKVSKTWRCKSFTIGTWGGTQASSDMQ